MRQEVAMISQPMNGFSDEEIKKVRERAGQVLEDRGYIIINTYFEEDWANPENMKRDGVLQIPLAFLSMSIKKNVHV